MTDEAQPSVPAPAAPPRLLVWAAALVCAVVALMVPLGAWQVGLWVDEPAHVGRFDNLQQHGWYLLDDDFDSTGEPAAWVTDQYVYAPVASQLMHGVNRVLGLDPADRLGTTIEAYGARHLVVGALGLLGVLAVVAIGRRLLGSWSWGLVSGATLLAIPMWPGLSMFDIKDVPAATGYTLVTLGLLELLVARDAGPTRPRTSWWGVAALTAGLVLSVGVRPGLWPGLAVGIGLALALGPGRDAARDAGARRTWWRELVLPVLVAGVLAYAVLLLSYPAYFLRPHEWLVGAIGDSQKYLGSPDASVAPSRTYLPERVVGTMPPLLLAVGSVGVVAAAARWSALERPVRVGWLIVAAQGLLLPAMAVVMASSLYDDLRQLLFAAPAVALLLTWGWQRLAVVLGGSRPRVWAGMAVLWSTALLVPTVVQLQLFPYGYTYASPVSDRFSVQKDWARMSLRALLPDIPAGLVVVCDPRVSGDDNAMRYKPPTGRPPAQLSTDCRTDQESILVPYGLAEVDDPERRFVQDTFVGLFTRGKKPSRNCEELGRVSRVRYVDRFVLGRVARCELVLNDYKDGGIVFAHDGSGSTWLLGGWTSSQGSPGIRTDEPFGALGVKLPTTMLGEALVVRFDGEAASLPEVLVNNEPVDVRATDSGWEVEVSSSTADSFAARRLVMTLVPADEEPLVLTRLLVEPAGDTS